MGKFLTRSRHGTVYYFRRRVPAHIQLILGRPFIGASLGTTDRALAVVRARAVAAQTDSIFQRAIDMTKKSTSPGSLKQDYTITLNFDDIKFTKSITVDAKPEEHEAASAMVKTIVEASLGRSDTIKPPSPSKNFECAIAEFLAKSQSKPQTKATYRSKYAHAQEFFGGKDADVLGIGQADLVRYCDHVLTTVPHVTTQGHYMAVVAGFLNWHRSRVSDLVPLTIKSLAPRKDTPEADDRDAFTLDELGHLFGNAGKYRSSNPSKFWVSIAPAFLGCRVEELCQIHLKTDLVRDDEADIWYFVFDAKPDPDGVVRKSMKKVSSWRRAPIHSALVRYGFIDFLLDQEAKGFQRPFQSEWTPRETESEVGKVIKWSHYISRWGGRELTAISTRHKFDQTHDLVYFHSMRHTFKAVLGNAGVSSEISEALSGRRYAGADAERYEKLKQNHRRLSTDGIERGLGLIEKLLDDVLAL